MNYVSTQVGTPHVRAARIDIYYPDNCRTRSFTRLWP